MDIWNSNDRKKQSIMKHMYAIITLLAIATTSVQAQSFTVFQDKVQASFNVASVDSIVFPQNSKDGGTALKDATTLQDSSGAAMTENLTVFRESGANYFRVESVDSIVFSQNSMEGDTTPTDAKASRTMRDC